MKPHVSGVHTAQDLALVEHELRYRFAAPLIRRSSVWCDLGCRDGYAASLALDSGDIPADVILIEDRPAEIDGAIARLRVRPGVGVVADLGSSDGVDAIRERLDAVAGDRDVCVTCFEVIQRVEDFADIVGLLDELARSRRGSVVLSLPNDQYATGDAAVSPWGTAAVDELTSMLSMPVAIFHQRVAVGSFIVPERAPSTGEVVATLDPSRPPSHFVVAFGKHVETLEAGIGLATEIDLADQRRRDSVLENDLRYYRALAGEP